MAFADSGYLESRRGYRQSEKITMNDLLAHRGPDDEGSVALWKVPSHPDELIYRLCVLSQTAGRDSFGGTKPSQKNRLIKYLWEALSGVCDNAKGARHLRHLKAGDARTFRHHARHIVTHGVPHGTEEHERKLTHDQKPRVWKPASRPICKLS